MCAQNINTIIYMHKIRCFWGVVFPIAVRLTTIVAVIRQDTYVMKCSSAELNLPYTRDADSLFFCWTDSDFSPKNLDSDFDSGPKFRLHLRLYRTYSLCDRSVR